MARASTARVLEPEPGVAEERVADFGGGPPPPRGEPLISNAKLGVMMLIGAEVMFFAGLIGTFLVLRLSSEVWPPPLQPRLPVLITGVNTLVLLGSGLTMHLGLREIRSNHRAALVKWLGWTGLLGLVFLGVQGYEWLRLIQFGLTMTSSVYGSTFYGLIGLHGLHVLGGLVWVGIVYVRARGRRYSALSMTGVEVCSMYWTFVVALWPVLYGLVYLY
jgi:heme/copper-type cytochrome/quinol oxidase subunit 3